MPKTKVDAWECNRCGHIWVGRRGVARDEYEGEKPLLCPKCRTAYWNTPRKYKVRNK